jgi:L-amino acid N-acyltransferase YncA
VTSPITLRRATPDDAASVVAILESIVAERTSSAIDCPFTIEQERQYLQSLSTREGIFLAEVANGEIVSFQSLDQWTKLFHSMDHVGQLGTFGRRDWRRCGIGRQLATSTLAFARSAQYEKLVIYVLLAGRAAPVRARSRKRRRLIAKLDAEAYASQHLGDCTRRDSSAGFPTSPLRSGRQWGDGLSG